MIQSRQYTNRAYLDALEQRVLIFDGAMGTSVQALELTPEQFGGEQYNGCIDYLVLSYPQAIEQVHRSFLEVGVDVLETDTFRANCLTLGEYGLSQRVFDINRAAALLARRLADEYSTPEKPRFVAGSIGPSGKLISADDPDLSDITFDELVEVFREQAVALIAGGVDLLLVETSQDILEVRAVIMGIQLAFEESDRYLPIQAQVTLDTTGRMLLGTDIAAAVTILEGLAIDVIGLNCSTGPEHMREPIRFLGEHTTLPISCIPNAGLPLNVDGEAVYPLQPEPFARALMSFIVNNHISVVGGCCGTTPAHLKVLVDKLGDHPSPPRPHVDAARLASAIHAIPMQQEPPPLLIGERCNAQGSRKFKRLLLAEDYDAILDLARQQVQGGAHALDISVAVTERADEAHLMQKVIKRLSTGVDVPLVIDTTELEVMELALKTAPGRCLINSTHLESGRDKADRVFTLAKQYNAAVLCLTIDEQGMARTAQRKLEVAKRLYDIAVIGHGLRPEDLVFDTLTFTLATGDSEYRDSAMETIAAIKMIKSELPGVFTSLGVSNVSFGLARHARPVLNSIMLFHAVKAGLDMAIVNPAHITPYAEIPENERSLTEDLLLDHSPDALQCFIEYFESVAEDRTTTSDSVVDPIADYSPEQRLHWRILHRHKEGVEADIDEILARESPQSRHEAAVEILNTILLPAMKEVGDKFGAGELILPFVLQSAEVMKTAVAHVEQFLDRATGTTKGTIVLATVYGDVHDIGKNLVKTILSNNGYTVVDLGKQVPAETIISKAQQVNANAIGLSALLVSTSKQMPLIVNELQRRGLDIPVLVGGAAINRRFGWRMLYTEAGEIFQPGVFYCKDAFEGLAVMDQLTNSEMRAELLIQLQHSAQQEQDRPDRVRQKGSGKRSKVSPQPIHLPLGVSWGSRVVRQMPLELVFKHLSKKELFRLSWGAKNAHGEEWEQLQREFEARLQHMQRAALRETWLKPQGIYGYWPVQAQGDEIIVYDPTTIAGQPQELTRLSFPRQPGGEHLCIADYFARAESGVMDVFPLQVVTVGAQATAYFDQLQKDDDYAEGYFVHGLAVQTAEAAADYLHHHILRELGLADGQGKRYSWGYPAVPQLEDHRVVFDLLPAESELGMSLTEAYQLVPEQSTAALIVHHPQAKYFSVGESRVEQLSG